MVGQREARCLWMYYSPLRVHSPFPRAKTLRFLDWRTVSIVTFFAPCHLQFVQLHLSQHQYRSLNICCSIDFKWSNRSVRCQQKLILGFGLTFVVFILFIGLVIHEYRSVGKRALPDKTTEKEPSVELYRPHGIIYAFISPFKPCPP
jgi:hypothetical protein